MSIKSSLEIALERTKDVQADPEHLEASTYTTLGKKLASQFLSDPDVSLADELKQHAGKRRGWVSGGIFEALTSNLALPVDEFSLKRNRRAANGLTTIIRDQRKLRIMAQQLEQFFSEYLQERSQLKENVDRQYAPRLQQKEDELARRTGQRVRLDPTSDPEYIQLLRQQMALLEDRYGNVLQQVRQELSGMFSSS